MAYDFKETESRILQFWEKNKIYQKTKEKNKSGKPFYFLEGPPYTSGKVHIGTAWNKSLKDSLLRYKRMQGFDVWDRSGYDMHGLPTENATEKKLGIKGKEEIVKLGVEKFVNECEELCIKNMNQMTEDFKLIGVSLDWEDPYQPITREYMNGVWWLIKKVNEKKRLYKGLRTMHWDAATATAVAKHELEYQSVTDDSIYLKFPVKGEENTFFVIWTTTPWTIPLNLAIMVSPKITYQFCKVENETWILAKDLASKVVNEIAEKDFTVEKTVTGKELEGMSYAHPYEDEIPFFKNNPNKKMHTVLLSAEHVTTESGTGLVHCAPGCGPEDYEVGHKNGLTPYNAVNEHGVFEDCGPFTDLVAKTDDKKFIEHFEKENIVIAVKRYTHDYPYGERSHEPVIFRTTAQWFFKVEDIKKDMIAANNKINWVPKAAYNAFNAWLENLRDNSITKQRFWGTPAPIWEAEDGEYIVVGSFEELEELSGQKIEKLHKPWIDEVTITKNGKVFKRIPDILDVWIDAGSASWNCLYFPGRKDLFEKLFPADFILEGIDQIRGWFNLLMVGSMLGFEKPSFKNVYMHGFLQDAQGRKMSKSLGNYILPSEVIEKYGADTLRYYLSGGANPGLDLNYNFEDMKLKYKNLNVLVNLQNYFLNLVKTTNLQPGKINKDKIELEEEYILAKLQKILQKTTDAYDAYHLNETPHYVESMFLETSRTYVQQIRDKVTLGTKEEKQIVINVLYEILLTTLKIFAPTAPFLTEELYQQLKKTFDLPEESVHHCTWPKINEAFIDDPLVAEVETAKSVIQGILAGREKLRLGVRWPLKEVIVVTSNKEIEDAVAKLNTTIEKQTNVRDIKVRAKLHDMKETMKPNFKHIGVDFKQQSKDVIKALQEASQILVMKNINEKGKHILHLKEDIEITKEHITIERSFPEQYIEISMKHADIYIDKTRTRELDAEGYAREVMRKIQTIRKEGGLEKNDSINIIFATTDDELKEAVKKHQVDIEEKCGIKTLTFSTELGEEEKIKGKIYSISYEKL
jgi:isoleucyl-tRNA synthetase